MNVFHKIFTLSPAFIIFYALIMVMVKINNYSVFLLIGIIMNYTLNKLLKLNFCGYMYKNKDSPDNDIFDRPSNKACSIFDVCDKTTKFQTCGFPSGHVQMITFVSIFTILKYYNDYKNNNMSLYKFLGISIIFTTLPLMVAYSRVKIKCHTILQTIAGAIIGAITAIGYYKIVNNIKL